MLASSCPQEVAERKRKGLMVGGTDHSWSDTTQSHHTASHVSIPASAGSEYSSMLDYQNQEHGLSEYKTVILGSLKKNMAQKVEELKKAKESAEEPAGDSGVYAAEDKFGSYSDSGSKKVIGEQSAVLCTSQSSCCCTSRVLRCMLCCLLYSGGAGE